MYVLVTETAHFIKEIEDEKVHFAQNVDEAQTFKTLSEAIEGATNVMKLKQLYAFPVQKVEKKKKKGK